LEHQTLETQRFQGFFFCLGLIHFDLVIQFVIGETKEKIRLKLSNS